MRVKDLKAADYNPRKITDEKLKMLGKAMKEFGDLSGIVVNIRTGNMVGGHQRVKHLDPAWEITKKKAKDKVGTTAEGFIETPFGKWSYREVDWTKSKEMAANIAANKHGGEFDFPKLKDLIVELDDGAMDIELTGFDETDLSEMFSFMGKDEKFHWRPGRGNISKSEIQGTKEDLILSETEKKKYDHIKTIAVQYSGGRDSSCALWWASKNFPEKNIIAVFSAVEVEFPGMAVFVEDVTRYLNVKLVIVRSEKLWWPWVRDNGWPSIIFRPCQPLFIHGPVDKYYKSLDPASTLLLDGSRAKQAGRGSKKTKTSLIPHLEKYEAYHPVYDLKEQEVWKILETERIPIWKGYAQGFVRTACWCCSGQCSLQAAMLQRYYPGLADEIRYWEKRLKQPLRRGGIGQEKTFDQIKRPVEAKIDAGATWEELYAYRQNETEVEKLSCSANTGMSCANE